jgi:hypothetical protein
MDDLYFSLVFVFALLVAVFERPRRRIAGRPLVRTRELYDHPPV